MTDLSKISACELSEELAKREGVTQIVLAPDETFNELIEGPCIIIINQD